MKNPFPKKGIGTRKFGKSSYYYAGRTDYWSKADLIKRELEEKGIDTKITRRAEVGALLWTSRPVRLDLSEPLLPRKYWNPTVEVHPEAIESLKRYKDDLKAGHKDAAEYWRGQAGAYFTANPIKVNWTNSEIRNYLIGRKTGYSLPALQLLYKTLPGLPTPIIGRTEANAYVAKLPSRISTQKTNPAIKPPPGWRYFDNRPTKAEAKKLGEMLEKKGYQVGIGKGKYVWHVLVKGSKNPTLLKRWVKVPDPISDGITEEVRKRAWKKGCVI